MDKIAFGALITSAVTFLFSFFGFLLSKIYFRSYEEYINLKSKVAEMLIYYGNVLSSIKETKKYSSEFLKKFKEASEICRKYAGEIVGYVQRKPKFEFWISKSKLIDSSHELIGISNTVNEENNNCNTINDVKRSILNIKNNFNIKD